MLMHVLFIFYITIKVTVLYKNEQKVGNAAADTRRVGISSMRKSIYIPPYNHTQ